MGAKIKPGGQESQDGPQAMSRGTQEGKGIGGRRRGAKNVQKLLSHCEENTEANTKNRKYRKRSNFRV